MNFLCPNCGASITADEPIASSLLTCPHCQQQCPFPRRKIRLRLQPLGTPPDLAEVGKQQPCPQCKVPMAADAVFCVKCGFDLRTGKTVQTVGEGKRPSQTRKIISIVCLLIALAVLWRVYTNRQRSEFPRQNLSPAISAQSAYPSEPQNKPSPTAAIVPANNEQSVSSEPETVRPAATLVSAVDLGQIETVKALLESGADANAVNDKGLAVLLTATWHEDLEVAQLLVDHGADVNKPSTENSWTPFMEAASRGNMPLIELYLQHKADINLRDRNGEQPIWVAAAFGQPAVVEKLLALGGDIQTRNNEGVGLLHGAASANDPHLIEFLLTMGFRIQEKTSAGATPLAFAAGHRSGAAVVTLLNHGADPHDELAIKNAQTPGCEQILSMLQPEVLREKVRTWDKMAMDVLHRNQRSEVLGLLDEGADPTELLQAAIEAKTVESVQIALSHGADPLATGDDGLTSLAHAEKTGNAKIIGLLKQALADRNTRGPALATTAPVKVVLTTLTSDDRSYMSGLAVENLTALLQAKLSNEAGAEWIERSQLQAAEHELKLGMVSLASPAAALRVGKWLKADLLVMGRVVTTPRQQRVLRLEVVDANRADVLAEIAIKLQSRLGWPLATADFDVEIVAQKIRSLLQQARQQLATDGNKPIIAPLFFANTDTARRLDFFESDLFEAIGMAADTNNVRVLRFPRASAARGEVELAMRGLSASDPAAWQRVADVYVWGRYEEKPVQDQAFEETPVTFTLTIWNGTSEPQTTEEIVKVKELAQLRERVVKKIITAARERRHTEPADSVRLEVARQLGVRAGEVQLLRKDGRSLQDQRQWQYEVNLLTTALFFAPELYDVHRKWLMCRWEYLHDIVKRHDLASNARLFGLRLEQLHDLAEFADAHGLFIPGTDANKLATNSWKQLAGDVVGAWTEALRVLKDPVSYGLTESEAFGLPFDTPSDIRKEWIDGQTEIFIGHLINVCERVPSKNIPLTLGPDSGDLEYLFAPRDKHVRVKFIELAWPKILEATRRDAGYDEQGTLLPAERQMFFEVWGLIKRLTKAYRAVGDPSRAEAMIAQLSQKNSVVKPLPTGMITQKYVLVNLPPPQLNPNGKYISFPAQPPAEGVVALQPTADAMWVSTRSGPIAGLAMRDDTSFPDGEPGLWRVPLASEDVESISSKIGKHSTVTSLLAHDAQLWMTLAQEGVWSLGSDNLRVTKYDGRNGVLSPLMMTSASHGQRLYFGSSDSKLNLLEVQDLAWKRLTPPTGGPIRALSAIDKAVLCDHSIDNLDGRGWQDISGKIIQAELKAKPVVTLPIRFLIVSKNPDGEIATRSCFVGSGGTPNEKLKILCAVPDAAAGFWIGSTHGLCRWNLTAGPTRVWFRGFEGYYVDAETGKPLTARPTTQLSGAVTALANDGDFLWVATTSRLANLEGYQQGPISRTMYKLNERHYVFLLHKPSEKWVACFPVSTCVASLSVTADKLWVGLESFRYLSPDRSEEKSVPSPLLVVLKQPLLDIPTRDYLPDSISEAELREKTEAARAAVR